MFSIAVFAKLFRQELQKIQHSEKKEQENRQILANCCLWFSVHAAFYFNIHSFEIQSNFCKFSKKISSYIGGIFPAQTAWFVCFCRKKREHVVKSSKIFVFFPQTSRFFCISHCTFSIKKGKKLRKSLAKRLQVWYNKCSTVQKSENDFCRETVSWKTDCSFVMQAIETERDPEAYRLFPPTVGFAGQCTLLQRMLSCLFHRFSLHRIPLHCRQRPFGDSAAVPAMQP